MILNMNLKIVKNDVDELINLMINKRNEKEIFSGDMVLNLTSLEFIEVIVSLEEKYGIEFNDDDLLIEAYHCNDDLARKVLELYEKRH